MNSLPKVFQWHELRLGSKVSVPFSIKQADMEIFRQLSGDCSRIHWDSLFAEGNGFKRPVVYGALIVAKLSYLVGMHLPGDLGLATSWKIDFNKPLYVFDDAIFEAELTHISESTHTIKLRFRVTVDGELIASGSAGSKLLEDIKL